MCNFSGRVDTTNFEHTGSVILHGFGNHRRGFGLTFGIDDGRTFLLFCAHDYEFRAFGFLLCDLFRFDRGRKFVSKSQMRDGYVCAGTTTSRVGNERV